MTKPKGGRRSHARAPSRGMVSGGKRGVQNPPPPPASSPEDEQNLAMGAAGNDSNSSHVVERDGKSNNTKLHSDVTAAEMQVNPISGDLSSVHGKLEQPWSSVQAVVFEHMALKDLDLDCKEVAGLNGYRYVGCNDLRDIALSSLHMFLKTAVEMLSCEGYTEDAVLNAILDSALRYQFDGPITRITEDARALLQSSSPVDYPRSEIVDTDLHMLGLYILCKASSLLKTYYPFFTWGDALWCILLCDMDISIAREVSIHISGYGSGQSEGLSVGHSDFCEDEANVNELSEEYGCGAAESPAQFEPPNSEVVQRKWSNILTNYIVSMQRSATKNNDAPSGRDENSSLPRDVVQHTKKATNGSCGKKNSNSMKSQKDSSKESVLVKNVPQAKGIGKTCSGKTCSSKTCSRILKESKSLMTLLESAQSIQSTLAGPLDVAPEKGLRTSTLVSTQRLSGLFSVKKDSNAVTTTGPLSFAANYLSYPSSSAGPKQRMDPEVVQFFLPNTPAEAFEFSFSRDGLQTTWVPEDRKEELALELVQRLGELKLEVKVWTDWANERVMQSTRRLVNERSVLSNRKDNAELEEPDLFNRKKLEETKKAIDSTSDELDRVNSLVGELTDKIALCRHEKKAAQLQVKQSDATLADMLNKENDSMERLKSMETEKILLQDELAAERSKLAKLLKSLEKARGYENVLKKRCQEGEKMIDELKQQIDSQRTELDQIDISARAMSSHLLLRARNEQEWLQNSIKNVKQQVDEISSRPQRVANLTSPPGVIDCVQRERECAMCLEEEISVVFLPCGHQIVCAGCNQRHRDGGMAECPSCRSIIQRRICARFSDS